MTGQLNPKIQRHGTVYQNPYQRIYRVTAAFEDFTKEYFVTDTGQKAGVVVVKNDDVLFVRQYRLLIDGLSWEIPGGKVDVGESPAEAAARECLEETGIRCLDLHSLLSFEVGLDTHFNPSHLFYCNNISEGRDQDIIHQEEVSDIDWLPLERCIDMIFRQEIVDSFTVVALLAYYIRYNDGGRI